MQSSRARLDGERTTAVRGAAHPVMLRMVPGAQWLRLLMLLLGLRLTVLLMDVVHMVELLEVMVRMVRMVPGLR